MVHRRTRRLLPTIERAADGGGTISVDERTRKDIHDGLADVLGPDRAAALMSMLPPTGWADVATKRDLDVLRDAMRSEFRIGMTELRTELRHEIGDVRTELRGEIGGLRGEIAGLRAEMYERLADQSRQLNRQTWQLLFAMIASVVAVAGIS